MMLTLHDLDRLPVMGPKKRSGHRKKIGKVMNVVFDPKTNRAIGYVVGRPDLLFIFRRRDLMLAFDSGKVRSDRIEVDGKAAWDSSAAKRLGISWDEMVIWRGMPVKTTQGKPLGYVRDAVVDEDDGHLNGLGLTGGIAADVAVGIVDMPARLVRGWNGSVILVDEEVQQIESEGGVATTAGRAAAVAQDRVEQAAVAAAKGAKVAAAYTKSAVRVAAKSDTAKKVGGFLKSIGSQIVEAAGVPEDDEKKK
jgi:sporulation protein YlmC with PRC-barrel domain